MIVCCQCVGSFMVETEANRYNETPKLETDFHITGNILPVLTAKKNEGFALIS